jgi:glycosyltransferase involved in cell wall biosynthesis
MKIFVHGADRIGWAIDQNRINLTSALTRQKYIILKYPIFADIIHNVCWNNLLSPDFSTKIIRFHPRIIVTTSNFIDPCNPNFSLNTEFQTVAKIAKGWIAFSTKQKKILENCGLLCFQMPNYVDLSIFHPPLGSISKDYLYSKYKIPNELLRGRIVIGSFQRDSLGSDLSKPKWQKNPDYLLELLEKIDKDKYILLLAGPRRHYIINQCKKRKIPYWYIGKEAITDDIETNNLPIHTMAELYWMCDLILVTSVSEGGPQAIIESMLTKTPIFSTNVGTARDFLTNKQVFENIHDFQDALDSFICEPENRRSVSSLTSLNYEHALKILNYDSMDKKLTQIYEKIMAEFS